ncbi:phosphatidylglycerophosphatase A family protein [Marinobacter zhejiangensis]|uniref:Phosphatidylglycerophosphatase A n=1 Tax=Marinobacter zhejiangensis TaxID=488535 RepID=A0A1I4S8W0_9GAMM|nr:phosphatidylglycerophosphatase A [Marinobacter zhejiangensis]SFM60909.1 phosphatidylglycerophosphatase A [Marinobacter zhejiangensis]
MTGSDVSALKDQALPKGFLRDPIHLLAFGLGSGAARVAPGTWGSLAAIPVWALFFWVPPWAYWLVVALASVIGIWLCGRTARDLGVHDHGGIVWDEFVGMWIALGLFQPTAGVVGIVLAFLLFRVFDILKPWPIRWFDRHMPGGAGIMFDDILAGVMALGVYYLAMLWLPAGWL